MLLGAPSCTNSCLTLTRIRNVAIPGRLARLFRTRSRAQHPQQNEVLPTLGASSRVEAQLLTILTLVNDWLQFAEAKNGGIIALVGVATAGILAYTASEDDVAGLLRFGLIAAMFFLVASLVVALLAFLPRTNPAELPPKDGEMPSDGDNLYFFGDLRKYRPEQLAAAVATLYEGIQHYDPARHRSHTDLASQIIYNSRITTIKNDRFRLAVFLTLVAVGVAIACSILTLLFCR